jgi:hypothetical protein
VGEGGHRGCVYGGVRGARGMKLAEGVEL